MEVKYNLVTRLCYATNFFRRHYGKYDFTCQQMFLDTVIKGAHTVKKTLYDARHSEFSNNMWEYAAHLRYVVGVSRPTFFYAAAVKFG